MSPAVVPHMEKVYSNVRQIYGRSPTDDLNDLDVNNAVVGYIHERHTPSCSSSWSRLYGEFYDLPRINSWCLWNSYSMWLENWSRIRQTSVVWPPLTTKNRRGDRRLYDVTKWLGEYECQKTYVFADSVLCLWSMSDQPVEAWKNKIKWYLENRYLKDLNRIDGEPMEFEGKIFTTLGIL